MAQGNALKGKLLVMTTVFLFALADTVGKHLVVLYAASLMLAAIFGWPVYDHTPDAVSLLGILMIAGAGMAVAVQTQRAKRALV